jgi:phosphatidylethanolamine/phosphatidyl-N-methylethanolamine N-methyltransferase
MKDWVAERSVFLKEWIRAPLVTASIVPSSKTLARAMARGVRPELGPVIELGPGTGVITRHLLEAGVPEDQLILVEVNHYFANQLRKKFPKARVIHDSAENLGGIKFDQTPAFAVSGIPLMSIPNPKVAEILKSVFSCLTPDGVFIQFTYAPRCPVNKKLQKRLGLQGDIFEMVLRNIPPAGVYHISRVNDLRSKR